MSELKIEQGFLIIVMYLQLVVIWIQAEVAMRQERLLSLQFEPYLEVGIEEYTGDDKEERLAIYLINKSRNPAYNIFVSRTIDDKGKPIQTDTIGDKIHIARILNLGQGEKAKICDIDKQFFTNKTIEIIYTTGLNEYRMIHLEFINGNAHIELPGITLNTPILGSFEDFKTFIKFRSILFNKIKTKIKLLKDSKIHKNKGEDH